MHPLAADDPRTIGEFRLHARLGAGGMGRVYLASSPGGRAVAVKVVHPHLARDTAFLGRFRREVAAALAVNGGYAAPVIAAGPDDDPPWLATAYVAGPSLQEVVTAAGPLPEDAVLKLAAGLAEALRAIHACGLVHRDLKPGNVLLAADGPRVIDFGIARALDGTVLTSAESLMGTPSFMSPEQAQGQPAGPASDVFSLGGVLYFAATGAGPFGSGLPAVMLYRIVHTEPDLDRLPPGLRGLAAACLAKDPAQRPAPAQLATALMGVAPPGDSPAAFWPAPVARLIADHQARSAAGPTPPAGPPPVARPGPPSGYQPTQRVAPRAAPGMGRRRALAALAGMAAGGLGVAGWELVRPGRRAPAAGRLAASHAAKPHSPGAMVWRSPVSAPVATVVVAGRTVFAGTAQDTVYALDAATGRLAWRRVTTHTINDQLVVAGNSVVIADADKGGVIALNAASGQQRWSVNSGAVLGLAAADGVVYAGVALHSNDTGGVTALTAASGEVIWTVTFPQSVDTNGALTVSDGVVYVTTSDGEIMAYRAADGTRLWRFAGSKVTFRAAPPVVAGGVVYACSGDNTPVLYAVKAANGRLLWHQPLGASALPAYVAVADDVVFVGMTRIINGQGLDAGDVSALNAANGQQLWKNRVAGGVDFGPATAPGVVYTGSNNGVLDAWQADTGNKLWSFSTGGLIGSNVALAGGNLYFGSNDNHVYAVAARS